jgi:hypothetical protein
MTKTHYISRRTAATLAAIAGLFGAGVLHGNIVLGTTPVGVMSKKLQPGASGLAFPLIQQDVFAGIVASNTGGTVTFSDSTGDIGAALDPQRPFYAEVATGALEGERLDVDVAATIAAGDGTLVLNLAAGTHSTLAALADAALADARVIVRPHVRLADLQAMVAPSFVGDNKHNKADGVEVFEGTAYAFYFLRADGSSWAKKDAAGEFRSLVIPPDTSVQVVLRSGTKSWMDEGVVRTNAFRKNLAVGSQAFATGFPEALSPVDLGAFANVGAPVGTEWTGNSEPGLADGIQLVALKPLSSNWYYLDASGLTWRRVAGNVVSTTTAFAGPTDAMILRRNNPDPDYIILLPFDL